MITHANLQQAWYRVQHSSRCAGVDGITPELFRGIAQTEICKLHEQILAERYIPQPVCGFHIPKSSGQHRLVGISTVRDRILQRALLEQIYPAIDLSQSEHSYAYRPGYSAKMAVTQLLNYWQQPDFWLLQVDIQEFFENLRWPILFTCLEQLNLDAPYRDLIERQIQVDLRLRGQTIHRHRGVIQGSVLSGALANLYLTDFDRQCQQAGMKFIRYGDDLAVACHSADHSQQTLDHIQAQLQPFHLALNPNKTQISPPGKEVIVLGHRLLTGNMIATVKDWHPYRPGSVAPKPHQPAARPAPHCSLKPSQHRHIPHPEHYWSDPMASLYITDQGASLRVKHQQFQIFVQQELLCQVPINRVSHVVLFGCCNLSHAAISLALRHRIPVTFLSQKGQYFGKLQTSGQAELDYLTQQVLMSQNSEANRQTAASIVLAKLHNSRIVLQRFQRRHPNEVAGRAIEQLVDLLTKIPVTAEIDVIRGYEGQGAKLYFQGLGSIFQGQFSFEKRSIRPPQDPINSLMSLGYTLLHENVFSVVVAAGLHTHFGHLHKPRKHYPALVMDLMEEFRAPIVDSLVAYLINTQIFTEEDFTPPDLRGGVYLCSGSLKKFLKHWEDKLQTEITHPHTGYKVTYRRCLELQVWEYVAWLMGDQPLYRPMLWSK